MDRPCILCNKKLESVFQDLKKDHIQPCGGGEVQFIFAYGSLKFDNNIEPTIFRGVICDECAEPLISKMDNTNEPK